MGGKDLSWWRNQCPYKDSTAVKPTLPGTNITLVLTLTVTFLSSFVSYCDL
jgi:hypothetical protein